MPVFEPLQIRIASLAEQDRVRSAYETLGYWKEIKLSSTDTVWLAETEGQIVGIVRIAAEYDTLVLRGMRVSPAYQRQSIGARLLQGLETWLGERECYCIPYSHLNRFYGGAGFIEIDPKDAPAFLGERLTDYRRNGLDVILMRRFMRPGKH